MRSSPRLFNTSYRRMVSEEQIVENGPLVHLPEHRIQFSPQQEARVKTLLHRFQADPFSPPGLKECQAEVGEDVLAALVDLGQLVQVSPEIIFRREDLDRMISELRQMIMQNGPITVAQVRDHFNTSRKYVLAFLEYLDSNGVTVRDGDYRRLK